MTATDAANVGSVGDADPDPAARGALYSLLARLFEHPDDAVHAAALDGSLTDEVQTYVDRSALEVSVPDIRTSMTYKQLAARYNELFELGHAEYTDRTDGSLETDGPPVPLYETRYRDASWDDVNVDLARAYDYFDVTVDEQQRDHHDNLRLELEFASYLARREALGDGDAARARRDLLDRHLEPFTDGICERIEEIDTEFYPDLARVAKRVISADLAALQESADGGGANG